MVSRLVMCTSKLISRCCPVELLRIRKHRFSGSAFNLPCLDNRPRSCRPESENSCWVLGFGWLFSCLFLRL
uniref:Uncharacterized protein n=1 Tax=Physcomitrium patens TaxID=3218 RepID=A0A2K1KVI0_PHYPA|nr:hypothetical protein PHYPA_004796 [Physcomitrium patens]